MPREKVAKQRYQQCIGGQEGLGTAKRRIESPHKSEGKTRSAVVAHPNGETGDEEDSRVKREFAPFMSNSLKQQTDQQDGCLAPHHDVSDFPGRALCNNKTWRQAESAHQGQTTRRGPKEINIVS